jgi:hypothetical protein
LVVNVIREPRNVLVSYCRHRLAKDNLRLSLAEALRDYWGWGCFVEFYRLFLGWRGRATILRYEDLAECSPLLDGTATGSPSRWQDVWDRAAEQEWRNRGGPRLLRDAGYA